MEILVSYGLVIKRLEAEKKDDSLEKLLNMVLIKMTNLYLFLKRNKLKKNCKFYKSKLCEYERFITTVENILQIKRI